ncbi:AAA family ATPase [Alkalihalobacterium alkalicellulosilyticum]|uniref:AAA family ATPase n=1 Tax=Alkalihalobacterium alkalicellulosilyticum TaxID=1912214 RepID=UPI0009966676|nr:AAA family ATPase [Bacillus alkalicellulosilyticus]
MLEQTDYVTYVKRKVAAWEKEPNSFRDDAEALRMLAEIDMNTPIEEEEKQLLQSTLYSLLAYSRFQRVSIVDDVTERWLSLASKEEQQSPLTYWVKLMIILEQCRTSYLPDEFPQIRETDHGSAKRKLAQDYVNLAEQFFKRIPTCREQLKQADEYATILKDDLYKDIVKRLQDLLQEIETEMLKVTKSTEAYKDSMTGIYYSATQLHEIRSVIQTVEQLKRKWEELVATGDETQHQSSALEELYKLIGLDDVKKRVEALYNFLQYQQIRKEKGFHLQNGVNLNMIITGNPGTGKTLLARTLAKIYKELGMLEKEEVVEVNRSHLVGGFVGQTEENTMNYIERALGGVLFIDEAYALKRENAAGNDYGQTAIDTLVAAMTNSEYAGKFAVILAGYPEEMRQFMMSNPGLRSRFPEQNIIGLPNYTLSELTAIAEKIAIENDFFFSNSGKQELVKRIEKEQVDETFGNARTVENIVQDAIFQKGSKLDLAEPLDYQDVAILTDDDVKKIEEKKSEQMALDRLEQLIGLEEVKKEVQQLAAFVKVQQLRLEKGLPTVPIQLHSVFTGNPGTGKTTVASLFAEILKEIGLLKRGHLIVTGRSDLVAGYIGQTAIKTKQKIREALGGVLFIDEAYALASGGTKDFGREAIDTLVEEMTKHDENLVVVLAGYPTEIDFLLSQNPGLQSRFKKHFLFPDYHAEQLVDIMKQHASQYGYELDAGLTNKLKQVLEAKKVHGNGRFAIDAIDNAIQNHAKRIIEKQQELTNTDLTRLTEMDFMLLNE